MRHVAHHTLPRSRQLQTPHFPPLMIVVTPHVLLQSVMQIVESCSSLAYQQLTVRLSSGHYNFDL
jgi:hypothetical protein